MRKCPKCDKFVPVGNRRCIYCRTVVETQDSGASEDNFDAAENNDQTLFGVHNKRLTGRRQMFNENTEITQNTIVGLPGISFSKEPYPKKKNQSKTETEDPNNRTAFLFNNNQEETQENQKETQEVPRQSRENISLIVENNEELLEIDDPLAGLQGVTQQKISSLIEEELDDLSTELFGSDFNFDDITIDDIEDDGLDFDIPAPAIEKSPKIDDPPKATL